MRDFRVTSYINVDTGRLINNLTPDGRYQLQGSQGTQLQGSQGTQRLEYYIFSTNIIRSISIINSGDGDGSFHVGREVYNIHGQSLGTINSLYITEQGTPMARLSVGPTPVSLYDVRSQQHTTPRAATNTVPNNVQIINTEVERQLNQAQPANTNNMARTATAPAQPQNQSRFDTLQNIEAAILASFGGRGIKVSRLLKRRTENLHDFLIRFFREWNNNRDTVYIDNNEVQTQAGCRRSLGDLFMICRHHYPEVSLTELLDELYNEIPTALNGFRSSMCSRINKRVWYYDRDRRTETLNSGSTDEYGHRVEWYTNRLN